MPLCGSPVAAQVTQACGILLFGICGLTRYAAGAGETATTPNAADRLFDFHSSVWVNLHHFLYRQAVRSGPQKSPRASSLTAADSEELDRLAPSERILWNDAVAYYRVSFASRDLLFDEDLIAVKNHLEDAEDSPDLANASIPSDLRCILLEAAPIYRQSTMKGIGDGLRSSSL